MMSAIQFDTNYPRLIRWTFDPDTDSGWNGYNLQLDELRDIINGLDEPHVVIFMPTADMPPGNPLPHIQRLIRVASDLPNLVRVLGIIPNDHRVGQTFAQIAVKAMRLDRHMELLGNEAEAIKRYEQLMKEVTD